MTLDHIILILDKLDETQFGSISEQMQEHHLSGILFLKDKAQLKPLKENSANIDVKEQLSLAETLKHLRQMSHLKADASAVISDDPNTIRFFRRSGFGIDFPMSYGV